MDEEVLVDSQALTSIISTLERTNPDSRQRLIETVLTYFNYSTHNKYSASTVADGNSNSQSSAIANFTEDRTLSPKEFIFQKQPKSDVERVACLAYYLDHYRGIKFFGTIEISKLNTEAAQIKFSNATQAVNNATKQGYLVSANKGNKQLSAQGEQYVVFLPDHESAKAAMTASRKRLKGRRNKNSRQKQNG